MSQNTISRLKPSKACYDLIKHFEGCYLTAYPDPQPSGLPVTAGWGSTMKKDGSKFKLGEKLTQQEADDLLIWEVENKSNAIEVPSGLKQCQFDAIVSFCYNVGIGNYSKSTLRKLVMGNPNNPAIRAAFMMYVKAGGITFKGLVKRRQAEADLYFS